MPRWARASARERGQAALSAGTGVRWWQGAAVLVAGVVAAAVVRQLSYCECVCW